MARTSRALLPLHLTLALPHPLLPAGAVPRPRLPAASPCPFLLMSLSCQFVLDRRRQLKAALKQLEPQTPSC